MVARNVGGECRAYRRWRCAFTAGDNVLDFLLHRPMCRQPRRRAAPRRSPCAPSRPWTAWGVFGIEMFLTADGGELLVNEVAPRTHNSGHHTIGPA